MSETFELIKNSPALDPEDVSQSVLYALSTRPHVQVFHFNRNAWFGQLNITSDRISFFIGP